MERGEARHGQPETARDMCERVGYQPARTRSTAAARRVGVGAERDRVGRHGLDRGAPEAAAAEVMPGGQQMRAVAAGRDFGEVGQGCGPGVVQHRIEQREATVAQRRTSLVFCGSGAALEIRARSELV